MIRFWFRLRFSGASLVAQVVKNLPAMQETQVQSLGPEDPLEKELAIHSGILAWRISWAEKPGRLQSMGSQSQTQLCLNKKYNVMEITRTYCIVQGALSNVIWQPGWEGSLGQNRIHVNVWLNLVTVHLKLSQHCLLIGYTPIHNVPFHLFLPFMWEKRKDREAYVL